MIYLRRGDVRARLGRSDMRPGETKHERNHDDAASGRAIDDGWVEYGSERQRTSGLARGCIYGWRARGGEGKRKEEE